jgi:O-antigen/teichoic acid export membrane protein
MNKTLIQMIKNVLTSWGAVGLQAAVGLYMVPFLFEKLGKEGYGLIGIIGAIIGFAEIADLGLRAALNRQLSENVAKSDSAGFRSLSSSALALYMGFALLIGAVGVVLAPALCSLFKVGAEYRDVTVLLLRTYAPLTVLVSFVTPVFTAGIASFMRYDLTNNVTMFSQLVVSVSLLVVLSLVDANPVILWCAVMALGAVIRLVIMVCMHRRICYGGQFGARHIRWASLVPLFKLGGSMYVLQLMRMLSERMDPLIISRFLGPVGVALYQAGSRLPQMVNPIVLAAVNQLTPLTTKYHVGDNKKREQQILILGTKYTLYLGAFFSAAMILFADSFCHLWLFNKLGEDVATVARVLKMWAVVNIFMYAGGSQWSILLGKKKMKFAIGISVPLAILNIVLSIFLVGYTNLGVAGVLVGTIIKWAIYRPISIWYVARIVGFSMAQYFYGAYLKPCFFSLALLVSGFGLLVIFPIESWNTLCFVAALYGLISSCFLMMLELDAVKSAVRMLIRRWINA